MKESLLARFCDLKESYSIRYTLCCEERTECSCSCFYHKHFFWSKAVVLVLLWNALFSTALHRVTTKLLQFILLPDTYTLPLVIALYGASQLLLPIIGHISDTYVSRHRVLQCSIWSAWVSLGTLGMALSLESGKESLNLVIKYGVFPIIFAVLSVSFACFMSNIVPFTLDQMQGASHVHYNSLFRWWYWTLNVGAIILHTPKFCADKLELKFLIEVEIGLVCITIALVLGALCQHWLTIEPCSPKENALLLVAKVFCYILRPHRGRNIPSTVQHELDLSSCNCLQLAKRRFGGEFETEDVESTKTFLFVLPVLLSIGFILIPYFGVSKDP